jgi:hypothetical protein
MDGMRYMSTEIHNFPECRIRGVWILVARQNPKRHAAHGLILRIFVPNARSAISVS